MEIANLVIEATRFEIAQPMGDSIPDPKLGPPARIAPEVRELTSNGGGILTQSWSGWTMSGQDEHGTELFSLTHVAFREWELSWAYAVSGTCFQ
jgi:hypothetical protein